jgi:tetratricopeptide (TPR) repeat protein
MQINDTSQKVLAQAVDSLRRGNPSTAASICRSFLVTNPGSVPHLQLLSHALIRLGQPQEARRHLDRALSIAPDFAPLYEDKGSLEGMDGNFDAAVEMFQRAVQLDPTNSSAHKKLARALADAGRSDEADAAIDNYLEHDEDAALAVVGAEHYRAARYEDAEAALRQALRKNPENVNAMRFLAMTYHRQDRNMDDAEALLRNATSIAPDFHQAFSNLGRVLIDNGKYADAKEAYEKLLELKPEDDDAWAGLGRANAYLGEVAAAAKAYQKSIQLEPAVPGVHMALAHMLKTLGDQEGALDHYRKAIKRKPDLGECYWSMANLKIFQFEQAEIDAMEEQLRSSDLSEQSRVNLEFSLGKAYEDQEDYAGAWAHYHAGNQHQRKLVDYDPVEHETHLQEVREAFDAAFFQANSESGHEADAPIFIVGLPRSGSTLVEQILASHSQVEGTAELPDLGEIAYGTGKYRHDGLAYPTTVNELTPRDFEAYGKEYLQRVARHRVEGRPYFIDKMPNNFMHVGWIRATLPNARVINTRRHPVASCLGVYKQLFAKGQHFTYDMLELSEFYRSYVEIMDHWHDVLPGAVLDIHYEETVTDLETQVRKILEFCGLPFEDECLRFYETRRAIKTASSEQVRQPIYTKALTLWQKYGKALDPWREDLADIIDALPEPVKAATS